MYRAPYRRDSGVDNGGRDSGEEAAGLGFALPPLRNPNVFVIRVYANTERHGSEPPERRRFRWHIEVGERIAFPRRCRSRAQSGFRVTSRRRCPSEVHQAEDRLGCDDLRPLLSPRLEHPIRVGVGKTAQGRSVGWYGETWTSGLARASGQDEGGFGLAPRRLAIGGDGVGAGRSSNRGGRDVAGAGEVAAGRGDGAADGDLGR